jgi:hypothetical protein
MTPDFEVMPQDDHNKTLIANVHPSDWVNPEPAPSYNLCGDRRWYGWLLFLINLAAGLTRLPMRTFFSGTMLGIIPGDFVYVNAGASLATFESLSGIASPRVIGSFALLGLFALIPVLYNKFQTRE